MHAAGSIASVIASIRAEADAEVERLRARGEEEIARLRDLPPETESGERELRLAAERKHAAELAAQVEWEERRHVIEQRETWIAKAIARGEQLLASAAVDERRKSLERLTREALQSVHGERVEIRVAARDRELIDEAWCNRISPGLTIGTNASIRGGCLVQSGALVFDNSYEQRAKRLEPVWRQALSGIYRV